MKIAPFSPLSEAVLESAKKHAVPIREVIDLKPVIERLAGARVVMLGESTHGTAEFYSWRRMITEWLIVKHGFNFIAVEGDWPEAHAIQRYITQTASHPSARDARSALEGFRRWPTWMWANSEMIRLTEWLRVHNQRSSGPVGFHGLDLYSLFESIDETIAILERINPFLAKRARALYGCFESYHRDEIAYARSTVTYPEGCREQVAAALAALQNAKSLKQSDRAELFGAEQNARVIQDAEAYYRTMIQGDEKSWNIRDRHMMDTLDRLLDYYGPESRGIVWAHNSHVGDYRATDMVQEGLVTIGGLARERYGEQNVKILGFGTNQGTVVASHAWDGPIQVMKIPPAMEGTYEDVLHRAASELGERRFVIPMDPEVKSGPLSETGGQRAIGVVYDPRQDRWGQYVPTSLANRYDLFFYIDETSALDPLILSLDQHEVPQTWPSGR